MASGEKKVQAYVSEQLYLSIECYAKHHNFSLSKAVAELLTQGLVGFSVNSDTQPLYSNVAESTVDISQFITRAEFESRMDSLLQSLGRFRSDVEASQQMMDSAASFIEGKVVDKLMADRKISKPQALLELQKIKREVNAKIDAGDSPFS